MALQNFKGKVAGVKEVADKVLQIEVDLVEPGEIEFFAGQFVMLHVPGEEGKTVKRAYSIASAPYEKGKVTFAIKLLEGGKASEYVRGFSGGEEVSFDGPLGHFYLREEGDMDLVFVGTGTGIAPIRSMILQNLKIGNGRSMKLFFGVRNEKDMFWHEEFLKLAEENESFEYLMTLSGGSEEWSGERGRVTEHLRGMGFENVQAYLCGSLPMVNEVMQILMDKGVEKENILKEIY